MIVEFGRGCSFDGVVFLILRNLVHTNLHNSKIKLRLLPAFQPCRKLKKMLYCTLNAKQLVHPYYSWLLFLISQRAYKHSLEKFSPNSWTWRYDFEGPSLIVISTDYLASWAGQDGDKQFCILRIFFCLIIWGENNDINNYFSSERSLSQVAPPPILCIFLSLL